MSSRQRVRVLIAEDHPVFRDAVVAALAHRGELEVVAVVENGSEALAEIQANRPDVAVLDIQMAGIDGVSLTRNIVGDGLPTRTLLLSGHHDALTVSAALDAGASGFLGKDSGPEEIGDAVLAIVRGETALSATVEAELARGDTGAKRPSAGGLSEREREVLAFVADGLAAPEIARRLGLRPPTVRTHLQNLYAKLGVSDRAAAVAEAMRRGLL